MSENTPHQLPGRPLVQHRATERVADVEVGVYIGGISSQILVSQSEKQLVGLVGGDVASESDRDLFLHFDIKIQVELLFLPIINGMGQYLFNLGIG